MQICLHPLNTVWSAKKSKMQPIQRLKQESNLKQAPPPTSSLPTISNEFPPENSTTNSTIYLSVNFKSK